MRIISNLNGNLLCPYQVLLDLCEQLPEAPPNIKKIIFKPICELNSTNDWINLESLGNPGAIRAKSLVKRIQQYLDPQKITQLTLVLHCDDGDLSMDNLYGLIYLSEIYPLELECFTNDLLLLTEKLSALTNIYKMSINQRKTSESDRHQLHLLQQKRQLCFTNLGFNIEENWLENSELNCEQRAQVIGYAWLCLKAGAYGPACKILEATMRQLATDSPAYEHLFLHLLMMRFFSHQYAVIALGHFPTQLNYLNPQEIQTLYFFKAYAATLSRHLTIAQDFFARAGIHAQMVINNETSLYQLNLFALSRVLLGKIETAFDLEFRIKEYCELKNITTVGLRYVNLINIARLYRKIKDYKQALAYYHQAYAQIEGGYSTGDHIYAAMNLAGVYEESGDKSTALNYWVQAALFWLVYDNKYALSWRPRLILCAQSIEQINSPLNIDKAHQFFTDKLKALIAEVNPQIDTYPAVPCSFGEYEHNPLPTALHIIQNITLFTRSPELPTVAKQSVEATDLQIIVSQFLYATLAVDRAAEVLIETRQELQFLKTESQAYRTMKLAYCQKCYFNGVWLNPPKEDLPLTISLGSAIENIIHQNNVGLVQYKRSFLNKALTDIDELRLISRLQQGNVEFTPTDTQQIHWINNLACKKLIEFCDEL